MKDQPLLMTINSKIYPERGLKPLSQLEFETGKLDQSATMAGSVDSYSVNYFFEFLVVWSYIFHPLVFIYLVIRFRCSEPASIMTAVVVNNAALLSAFAF